MTAYSTNAKVYIKSGLSSSDVATATVDQLITYADAWIERKLSKTWKTASAKTDYFDTLDNEWQDRWEDQGGRITGQKPFFESRPNFTLEWSPVTKISNVWLLSRNEVPDLVYSYDDDAGTYTDNTDEATSVGEDLFYAFASSVGIGDILYVGCAYKFLALSLNLATAGVGGVCTWEYYNGTAWTTLTVTEGTTNGDDLNASSLIYWDRPADWEETSVNSSSDMYWVRIRVTTAHSTSPKLENIYFDHDKVITKELAPNEYTWYTDGRLILRDEVLSAEAKKIRVAYYAGAASVPTMVEELSTIIAAIGALLNIMGGTHDKAATYQLGSLQVGKGEPYASARATIRELIFEREELIKQLGVDVYITTA